MEEEQERLRQAIDFTLLDLMTLTAKAEASGLDDIAAIFSGHHTLLDDPELLAAASQSFSTNIARQNMPGSKVLKELSQQYQQLMMNIYKLAILMWTIFCIAPWST
ncbi:phosphoenolpyruvate-utilizing N-terminal domain-containing protein [Escherichia coli]